MVIEPVSCFHLKWGSIPCGSAYLYLRTPKGHGIWAYHIIEGGGYNLQSKDIWLVLLYLWFLLNVFLLYNIITMDP